MEASHQDRALSFGGVAALYDTYRPAPPESLAEWLGDLKGIETIELAAGTGLLTRFLESHGATVIAVEPDDAMRAVLVSKSPGVVALAGTAEHIPAADGSADLVICSSAWHWFTQPDAAIEIARVLRRGGNLVVLWNGFDRSTSWIRQIVELREPSRTGDSRSGNRQVELPVSAPFGTIEHDVLTWTWTRTVDQMVQLFRTYSGSIVRSDEERQELDGAVRRVLEPLSDDGVLAVPMACRCFRSRRSAS